MSNTWADGIAPDPILHIVCCDALRKTNHGCLSGTIHTAEHSSLDAGSCRRHVDDVALDTLFFPLTKTSTRNI